jgi:hypothetical protein
MQLEKDREYGKCRVHGPGEAGASFCCPDAIHIISALYTGPR